MVEELTMKDEKQKLELKNPTINQTIKDCQVFNGPISGCVFAMPGAVVNQSPVQKVNPTEQINHDHCDREIINHDEELFKFIHPSKCGDEEWQIHDEVKRLATRQGVQEICKYLNVMEADNKILLPQSADVAYTELVRMGMPNGEGYNIKTFMKYYRK